MGARMTVGRPLCSDEEAEGRGFFAPDCGVRRRVLRETLEALATPAQRARANERAAANLARWRTEASGTPVASVQVLAGDWGEVTQALTRQHGACFAVLNMANAYVPGGAYVEGAVAQEENMFRRTDCHFHVRPPEYDARSDRYVPSMTRLLEARDGRVYLDVANPRVCIRGPEDRGAADLGYRWLADDEVFPFMELRAAARDRRDGRPFDAHDARRRIRAQVDTLKEAGVRHVVFGAFGCGAFRNPADAVAAIYRDELQRSMADFDVVAFAVFHAGYGPDNHAVFARVLSAESG
jgi:hypothetical protein